MCRSPNHAGASEANLSTVSWLMKRPSRAVHQALQRQRVIAAADQMVAAAVGSCGPSLNWADGSARTGRAHSGGWR